MLKKTSYKHIYEKGYSINSARLNVILYIYITTDFRQPHISAEFFKLFVFLSEEQTSASKENAPFAIFVFVLLFILFMSCMTVNYLLVCGRDLQIKNSS